MFEVAEKFEECMEFSEINAHLQFWDNMTGKSLLIRNQDCPSQAFKSYFCANVSIKSSHM